MSTGQNARAHRSALAVTFIILAVAASAHSARAASRIWSNPAGGSFTAGGVGGNWGGSAAPGVNDNAIFNLDSGGYTVTFSQSVTTLGLEVQTDVVTFDLNAHAYTLGNANGSMVLAGASTNVAKLTLLDGTLNSNSSVVGGNSGNGGAATLNVASGGILSGARIFLGNADLNITGGGMVSDSDSAIVGSLVGATADVLVAGAGSQWTVTNGLTIGSSGHGNVTVEAGGAVVAGATQVGQVAVSGTLTLRGAGSTWTNNGGLSVGASGASQSSTVSVQTGATLTLPAANTLVVNDAGVLTLSGGTITTGALNVNAGGTFDFNSGTLNLTKSGIGLTIGTGGLLGADLRLAGGQRVRVANTAQVNSGASLTLADASFAALTLSNSGDILLQDAAANLGDPGDTLANSGLISGRGKSGARLVNNGGGEVRIAAGDQLLFTQSSAAVHQNNGQINLLGGTLEFRNTAGVDNLATGVIQGQGTFITNGRLKNTGKVTLSGGASNVFGPFENTVVSASPAKVLVTGGATATFYDNVTLNTGSTFQVSALSSAVFLGNLTAAANTFTGPGTKYFEGTAVLAGVATPGASVVEAQAGVTANFFREDALTVNGTLLIRPRSQGGATSAVHDITIDPAGHVDLADNALLVDYTGPSPLAAVRTAILNHSLTSSMLTSATAIGYAEASDVLSPTGGTFVGQAADASTVLARFTLAGDANLDSTVDFNDLVRLAQSYNATVSAVTDGWWGRGDFTGDGVVDFNDLVKLAQNYNTTLPAAPVVDAPDGFAADFAAAIAQAPEPAAPALLAILALFSARRKRAR
jgi:T5SS/PEP-CTERM-associated repeat protein